MAIFLAPGVHLAVTIVILWYYRVAKMFTNAVGTVMAVEDNSTAYPTMPLPATPLPATPLPATPLY